MEELNELASFATQGDLDMLSLANPSDWDDVHALLITFPELFDGDTLPRLSNEVARRALDTGHLSIQDVGDWRSFSPRFGAEAPDETSYPVGSLLHASTLRANAARPRAAGTQRALAAIDSRLPNWPVKDQGSRGTCVSFAVTACAELQHTQMGLSEQFLFWATKAHHDPLRYRDGTRIAHARSALSTDGICKGQDCRYSSAPIPAGKFQGGAQPTHQAIADATNRVITGNAYGSATANAIYSSLAAGRPTCIALPVFRSASPLGGDNWTSSAGQNRGRVLDPPPNSTTSGGHAVCVTGFVPDPNEALGGYFVIRNSWGSTQWGRLGNPADPRNPEPGYGSVSATYVDNYAWEWLNL